MSGAGFNCGAGFQPATLCRRRLEACTTGFTLLEMLTVLTIVLILTAAIVSGYTNAERGQRLGKNSDRVLTALNQAKNLAISNNAVTYLEIIDDGPVVAGAPPPRQLLKVHVFPNVADALKVTGEPANTSRTNPYSNTPPKLELVAPTDWAWNPTKFPNFVDPASVAYQDSNPKLQIPGTGVSYNNWLADSQVVDRGTYVFSDDPIMTKSATGILIGFNPDGTLCTSATKVLITDTQSNFMSYSQVQMDAPTGPIANKNPHLKVIDVYGGGLIKQEL